MITEGDAVACDILIDPGVLSAAGLRAAIVPEDLEPQRIAVLAQPGSVPVAAPVAAALPAVLRVLPDREGAKQLSVVEACFLWLNDLGFTRSDLIVAVGGGALTDAAGFVAATYLRGVPVVLVPTTLLGAVDAAIGGKTGVNVGGKNLAGVFRHPDRVVIDPDVIGALPLALLREGAAEAVKAGFIGDPELVAIYERGGLSASVAEVVARAVHVKADIVSRDFREGGVRAYLNYGHTVGHAIEVAVGISHGAAVAIGMVAAAAVSQRRLGFAEAPRQLALLESLGLSTRSPSVSVEEVRRLMMLDKKRDAGGLRMTLLRRIGSPELVSVDDDDVAVALAAIGL